MLPGRKNSQHEAGSSSGKHHRCPGQFPSYSCYDDRRTEEGSNRIDVHSKHRWNSADEDGTHRPTSDSSERPQERCADRQQSVVQCLGRSRSTEEAQARGIQTGEQPGWDLPNGMMEHEGNQAGRHRQRNIRPVRERSRRDSAYQQITKDSSAHGGDAPENNDPKEIEVSTTGDGGPLHGENGCRSQVESAN
jgi:hypothetical protein